MTVLTVSSCASAIVEAYSQEELLSSVDRYEVESESLSIVDLTQAGASIHGTLLANQVGRDHEVENWLRVVPDRFSEGTPADVLSSRLKEGHIVFLLAAIAVSPIAVIAPVSYCDLLFGDLNVVHTHEESFSRVTKASNSYEKTLAVEEMNLQWKMEAETASFSESGSIPVQNGLFVLDLNDLRSKFLSMFDITEQATLRFFDQDNRELLIDSSASFEVDILAALRESK